MIGRTPPTRQESDNAINQLVNTMGEEYTRKLVEDEEFKQMMTKNLDVWAKFRTNGEMDLNDFVYMMRNYGLDYATEQLNMAYLKVIEKNKTENLV